VPVLNQNHQLTMANEVELSLATKFQAFTAPAQRLRVLVMTGRYTMASVLIAANNDALLTARLAAGCLPWVRTLPLQLMHSCAVPSSSYPDYSRFLLGVSEAYIHSASTPELSECISETQPRKTEVACDQLTSRSCASLTGLNMQATTRRHEAMMMMMIRSKELR
jgi:hypothetical protein